MGSYVVLKPTSKGKAKIDKQKKDVNYGSPIETTLDILEEYVRAGKYTKALNSINHAILNEFIEDFNTANLEDPANKKLIKLMRRFLSIGKSFYEYDLKQQEIVDNITYDGLMSRYLATGAIEPYGIVPKGEKNIKKIGIRYPSLHNNMDKAYAILGTDPIPEGVKESDCIEAFLKRAYIELEMGVNDQLTVELSPKLDGVSVNGTIIEHNFVDPQTRGDDDESVAVSGMSGMVVSPDFSSESQFGIQYEAFVTDENRIKASEYLKLERPYVSCRHAAAGIVHRLYTEQDPNLMKMLCLYPIAAAELEGTYLERTDYIQNFGIVPRDMIPRKVFKAKLTKLLEIITNYYHSMENIRENLSFAIDGIVITIADDEAQEILGRNGRTNKYQIALKFDPATAKAVVKGISLDSGKKGYRTIQIELEHPVFLDGVRYDHVPALSAGLYKELYLRVGSEVSIHRVGDVIPAITVIKHGDGKKLDLPTTCPSCGKPLIIHNKKLYCGNFECPDNIIGNFTDFFAKMGLTGYSDSFSEVLVKKLGCKHLGDVLHLTDSDFTDRGVTLAISKGFADKLKEAIADKRDYEVLGAIGLPGVGPQKAKILLQDINLLREVDPRTSKAAKTQLLYETCKRAVGPEQAHLLECYLVGPTFAPSWMAIAPLIKKVTENFEAVTKVGHTGGKLSPETMALCDKLGFEVVDGSSFDILITSSLGRESTKITKAKKKGAPIFLEEDFISQYS